MRRYVGRYLPGPRGQAYLRKERRANAHVVDAQFAAAQAATAGRPAIDLGSNLGSITRRLAQTASRVYAFEPDPWSARRLRNKVADLDNVEVIEAAAGTSSGTAALYRHRKFDTNPVALSQASSLRAGFGKTVERPLGTPVEVVDFVAFLRALDAPVGILKIDIEGGELELLETLMDSDVIDRIDYVFCETHEVERPDAVARYRQLRKRAARCAHPVMNMEWN
jgi:FkbM family methyltransferase